MSNYSKYTIQFTNKSAIFYHPNNSGNTGYLVVILTGNGTSNAYTATKIAVILIQYIGN